MLGYECPCCNEMICIAKPQEKRDCPYCKATMAEQTAALIKKHSV